MMSDIHIEEHTQDQWYVEVSAGSGMDGRTVNRMFPTSEEAFAWAKLTHDAMKWPPVKVKQPAHYVEVSRDEIGLAAVEKHIRDEFVAQSPFLSALAQDEGALADDLDAIAQHAVDPPHELYDAPGRPTFAVNLISPVVHVPERDTAHEPRREWADASLVTFSYAEARGLPHTDTAHEPRTFDNDGLDEVLKYAQSLPTAATPEIIDPGPEALVPRRKPGRPRKVTE